MFFLTHRIHVWLGCDIGGAKELGVIYFPTDWGAKEPQNLPNHRVEWYIHLHLVDFYGFHVGKYTSPMDPYG